MQADSDTELVGEAIAGSRDEAFLVSAAPRDCDGTVRVCHGSLRRLGTGRLEL